MIQPCLTKGWGDCSFCLCHWGLRVDSGTMGSAKSICSSHFTEEALKTLLHINTRMQCMESRRSTLGLERHQDVRNHFSAFVDSHVGASAGLYSMRVITKSH